MDVDLEKNVAEESGIPKKTTTTTGRNLGIEVSLERETPGSPALRIKSNGPPAYAAVVAELKSHIVEAANRERKEEIQNENELKQVKDEVKSNNKIGISGSGKKQPSLSRKPSENTKNKSNQEANFVGFEKLRLLKSVSMSLDWVNFKIKSEDGEELFQAVQSKCCSLSLTGPNELYVRKINAENVLRISSNVEEDLRNFNFYTASDKHIGSIACNISQTFKVPSTIKNRISGRTYNVSVQHELEGASKFWQIDDALEDTTVASVKVRVGHRWKSIYTLTFIKETSISSQILILGFLLALASARLESEIVPAFFAVSAVFLTFIIFFIIQFN